MTPIPAAKKWCSLSPSGLASGRESGSVRVARIPPRANGRSAFRSRLGRHGSGCLEVGEGEVKAVSKFVAEIDESTDMVYFLGAESVEASLEAVPDDAHYVPCESPLSSVQKCWRRDSEPGCQRIHGQGRIWT